MTKAQVIENDQQTEEVADEVSLDEMYGERKVRWYQNTAKNEVIEAVELGLKRILVVLPTGAGKTMTSGLIFSDRRMRIALGKKPDDKLRILFIAHKHRLLSQAEKDYAAAENVELILQSAFTRLTEQQIAQGWDFVCIDEAHHEAMMSIQLQLENLGNSIIIGMTATPDRADGCLIKFERIVAPISREQAVEEGYLAPTKLYSFVDAPERNKSKVVIDILKDYADQMGQTMIFMRTKKEVAEVARFLEDNGFMAIAITDQSERELNQTLDQFSHGEFQFVINCNKINEGVDVVGCESVLLGRTFGSYPQLNQVIGRASRPDSECKVWELINPLSGTNLDTTVVVGTPEVHKLIYRKKGNWVESEFDYTAEREWDAGPTKIAMGRR